MKTLISDNITFKFIKKYSFLENAKPFFPYRSFSKTKMGSPEIGKRRKEALKVKEYVTAFYEDDSVSTLSPAKGDQIVRKKVKKQKRFLTNSLRYLFKKFSEESTFLLLYSSFCKLHPFGLFTKQWIPETPVFAYGAKILS
jgi:hypothetical protein